METPGAAQANRYLVAHQLTSLQQRLVKTGGRLVKHARYWWLLLAEGQFLDIDLQEGESEASLERYETMIARKTGATQFE